MAETGVVFPRGEKRDITKRMEKGSLRQECSLLLGLCWVLLALPGQGRADGYVTQCVHLARSEMPIAGIPVDEALKIAERHTEALRQLPGAISVSFTAEGLAVETQQPTVLPAAVENLPVFAIPPGDSRVRASLPGVPTPPQCQPRTAGGLMTTRPLPALMAGTDCCASADLPQGLSGTFLPSPAGVIVLRPSPAYSREQPCPPRFVRWWERDHYTCYEQAVACPVGFQEWGNYGWRFCFGSEPPSEIPLVMVPPIAGIPYAEALAIFERQRRALARLPGVRQVIGIGQVWFEADGVHVQTATPAVVPAEVEGLPIHSVPLPTGGPQFLAISPNGLRDLPGSLGSDMYGPE